MYLVLRIMLSAVATSGIQLLADGRQLHDACFFLLADANALCFPIGTCTWTRTTLPTTTTVPSFTSGMPAIRLCQRFGVFHAAGSKIRWRFLVSNQRWFHVNVSSQHGWKYCAPCIQRSTPFSAYRFPAPLVLCLSTRRGIFHVYLRMNTTTRLSITRFDARAICEVVF